MMLLTKHIFQKKKCRILSMSARAQEHVRSRSEVFLRMLDLQEYV